MALWQAWLIGDVPANRPRPSPSMVELMPEMRLADIWITAELCSLSIPSYLDKISDENDIADNSCLVQRNPRVKYTAWLAGKAGG
ncbi:hypothetical protein [Candidatus Nitrospira inopinata]|jgi:hypothetical protein|uniref:hypothetical protein n=1 Tax=Candidatus Nitrospira inopinata TaxID=1715989 RepID=UPI00078273C2|nr:hypothetical protein [Candidatus Nitrospira inopinata]